MQGVTLIDLSGITRVDTAGVALLAHLVAVGKKQGTSVRLHGASDNVVTLAQLYNLASGRPASLIFSVRYFRKP